MLCGCRCGDRTWATSAARPLMGHSVPGPGDSVAYRKGGETSKRLSQCGLRWIDGLNTRGTESATTGARALGPRSRSDGP